jgi:predicted Fe-Mo cluster-binding NifX family protein
MKLAIPLTATDEFSPHYGAAAKFVVIAVDADRRIVHRRLIVVPQATEPCRWPRLLRAAGVDLLLAGRMGEKARRHMAEHGVTVLGGIKAAQPLEIEAAWLNGQLVTGSSACDGSGPHHAGSGEHHDEGCSCN